MKFFLHQKNIIFQECITKKVIGESILENGLLSLE
jgi:hypothetical protein